MGRKKRGQGLKEALALGLLRISARLSLAGAQRIGRALGWIISHTDNTNRRAARINLAHCYPELPPAEREALMRQCFRHLGMCTLEGGPVWLWSPDRLRAQFVEVHGEEHFTAALATGKPLIIAGPHIGNWEIMGAWFAVRARCAALYRPPRLPALDRIVKSSRERLPMELAPADHGGVKALLSALKAGKSIITLVDHEPSRGTGTFAPFFGRPAYTGVLAPRLARRTGAQVLIAAAIRLDDGRGFALHIRPGPDFSQIAEDDAASATEMNAALEQLIRDFPEQFLWNYKRFRTRPEGETGRFYPK